MPDYLSQLALRIQQPEFAVQPRPVSRFESQRHSIPTAPELSAPGEADERGSQSSVVIPAETNAGRLTQPADSRTPREPDTLDPLSEVQPTKKYHNLYPGQSSVAPAMATPARGTETTDSPVLEVAQSAPYRQQAEQSEQTIRSAAAQAQTPVRSDKRASAVQAHVISARGTETIDSPVLEVAQSAPCRQQAEQSERTVRSAVAQALPDGRLDRLEEQTSKASFVRIENPKREGALSLPPRALTHKGIGAFSELTETEPLFGRKAEIATKPGFLPVPGSDNPQPLGESADAQFGMARATDAPTIQVTIGRVEIRATVASAPTRKTPTQKPVMSLDEYLKQRGGSRG